MQMFPNFIQTANLLENADLKLLQRDEEGDSNIERERETLEKSMPLTY